MNNHALVQQIDAALASHSSWHREMIIEIKAGKNALAAKTLADPRSCFFGRWLENNELDSDARTSKPFRAVRSIHEDCHEMMAEIATLTGNGRKSEAVEMLNDQCGSKHKALEMALMDLRAAVTRRRSTAA